MPNKQTEITVETRQSVYERQKGFSPLGSWLGSGYDCHHVINTALGEKGVGYEWNIVALTREEHRAIHDKLPIKINGHIRYTYQEAITLIKNHLKINYIGWNEEKCKVHKGWDKEDYEIVRRDKV